MKTYYVYILASRPLGTLYVGITNDIVRRTDEHRNGVVEGFTQKYGVKRLVYFEETESVEAAILREKQLKKWNRQWKVNLIEKDNLLWEDLAEKP
ncbi:MAG: GIY-YIG nuclease family protein [Candidatus Saccharibacteria bacterium]